jgi:sodium/potassium/calcium exchanger 6
MCAIKPFRAKKFSFIRDVSFFTCAILLVMAIVSDGLIHLYESIILILFYAVYVLVVVGGNYYMKKRSNYLNLVERARLEYEENGTDVDILLGGNDSNGKNRYNELEKHVFTVFIQRQKCYMMMKWNYMTKGSKLKDIKISIIKETVYIQN